MSKYLDKSIELRSNPSLHYNCAQATVVPFAEEAGISEEMACKMTSNFGGGLKCASTCGAIVGGLMVLGMNGKDDPATVGEYYRRIKGKHDGFIDCANLLRINKENGGEKKPHCDNMIYECIQIAEELIEK